jgi:hypothetical protein
MKKTSFLVVGFSIIGYLIFVNGESVQEKSVDEPKRSVQEKITIAACPTCQEIAEKLDPQKYKIIATQSTSESVELVENQQADFLLAGRKLKSNEPRMEGAVIGKGFSFIGSRELSIQVSELGDYTIYTDLAVDMIRDVFPVEKIEKVENVYQYLEKGIAITTWENTDYSKANIIHLLENDGERVKLSRQPTLYCPVKCDDKMVAEITSVL